MSYRWIPGTPLDTAALDRMAYHFTRPYEPMGEAWFMGESRGMYTDLVKLPPRAWQLTDLKQPLVEITSGTMSFGHLPEWDNWLRYLLPTLISRAGEMVDHARWLESIVSAVMAVFEDNLDVAYPGFPVDVLDTLGAALMGPEFWQTELGDHSDNGDPDPRFLHPGVDDTCRSREVWHAYQAPTSLSAAMAFAFKYLPEEDFPAWVESLCAIRHAYWRAALLVWYVGACTFARSKGRTVRELERIKPRIYWKDTYRLGQKMQVLPASRLALGLAEFRRQLTLDRLGAWEKQFYQHSLLEQYVFPSSIISQVLATLSD